LTNPQPLHHFLAESPWDIEAVRAVRLQLLLSALKEQEFILCIDETVTGKKVKPQIMLPVNILVTWAKQKMVLSRSMLREF
jgi:SRSO17 transposase